MPTLAQTLAATRASIVAKLPPEVMTAVERQIVELRASGIADRVRGVGETMPAFELVNQHGNTVSSAPLLARGPLVVTFYRGKW